MRGFDCIPRVRHFARGLIAVLALANRRTGSAGSRLHRQQQLGSSERYGIQLHGRQCRYVHAARCNHRSDKRRHPQFHKHMTIVLASNLTIANDVTIDGTVFTVALDGGNSTEVFLINTGATVQLTHLVVQNGYDAAGGGGIYNSGTLALTDSSVLNSFGASGGGIWNVATLTLTNSTLPRNRASYGGAIQNSSGTLTITNSTLSGNTATVVGGGISSVKGTLTLTNSTMAGNTDLIAGYSYSA